MAKAFHDQQFDDATNLKLEIFRGYIRKWIPVFLTEYGGKAAEYQASKVNFFDFFSGPGSDGVGTPGSPLIIQDELKRFCAEHAELKAGHIDLTCHFNDLKPGNIATLKTELSQNACDRSCCSTQLTSLPFAEAFQQALPLIQAKDSANLIIMDQFGIKEVTPDIIKTLSGCKRTDILFFISSSYIHRFSQEPAIQDYFQVDADELAACDYKSIHRYICDYFRSQLPQGCTYNLAPFSIKKGSNIYGIIFGSGNLLGLQKFLEVCWDKDSVTGEANYNIDDDLAYGGDEFLFEEMNVIKKQDSFCKDLEEFLVSDDPALWPNNIGVYRFTLQNGFLPRHANAHLKKLQSEDRLEVRDMQTGKPARKGSFYLSWDNCKKKTIRAFMRIKPNE